MRKWIRGALTLLAMTAASASAVSAECATYLTSTWNEEPFSATLLGTKTVSVTLSGSGFGISGSVTETYEVGTYQAVDGSLMELNCTDYSPYILATH